MSEVYPFLVWLRGLKIDPLAVVIVLAILGAWLEQRIQRRGMADLTSAKPDRKILADTKRHRRYAERANRRGI